MLKEFREFAVKGNVIDLAVGVIIGGAFSKIVSSLVNDLIMPFLGFLTGGIDLTKLTIVIPNGAVSEAPLAIKYGMFLQSILDFLIIAFSIFIFIRLLMKFKKAEVEVVKAPEAVVDSPEVVLLREIRDSLKK